MVNNTAARLFLLNDTDRGLVMRYLNPHSFNTGMSTTTRLFHTRTKYLHSIEH